MATTVEHDTTAERPLPDDRLHHMLYLLKLARYFDERMEALYRQGRLPGAIYSGRGQEGTHVGVAFCVLQATLQAPQLSGSFVVSMQRPWQHSLPGGQSLPASRSQPCTHSPDGLHWSASVQSAIVRQTTHWCRTKSQCGAAGLI